MFICMHVCMYVTLRYVTVETVKERISKLRSTMNGFEYDEVIKPLSISFKNINMTLKSNGNHVDSNSGVVLLLMILIMKMIVIVTS